VLVVTEALAQYCGRLSTDDCPSSNPIGSIFGYLITIGVILGVVCFYKLNKGSKNQDDLQDDAYKRNQERIAIEQEKYAQRIDKRVKELVEEEKNASSQSVESSNQKSIESTNLSQNETKKIKTIPCINCKQKLRLTAIANKELEITCPKCRHKWVANFKTLL
jgi:DNA-directed RNA polymerase subunit RPC12/RpoP